MKTKICYKCGIEKETFEFTKDKSKKDSLSNFCKECKFLVNKKWRTENSEKHKECQKNWYNKNDHKRSLYYKEYRNINRKLITQRVTEYVKNRKNIDVIFKLRRNLRSRTYHVLKLKNIIKSNKTVKLLGCTVQELKNHLERQFTSTMNWDNYGQNGWNIDHRIPLSSAKTEEDLNKLCHYSNLQPLWWDENLKKSNKV